jgi:hypothetical protein
MQLQFLLTHYYTDVQSHRCLQDAPVDVGTTNYRQVDKEGDLHELITGLVGRKAHKSFLTVRCFGPFCMLRSPGYSDVEEGVQYKAQHFDR